MTSPAAMGCSASARGQVCRPALRRDRVSVRPLGGVTLPARASFLRGQPCRHRKLASSTAKPAKTSSTVLALAGEVQIDVDKPLGLKLAESKTPGGGLLVRSASGNASKAGIKTGDTVIYTSSYFGDELWPSANITFTRSALARCPSPVTIVYVRGDSSSIDVRRLGKRKAPPRFGRKLTPAQAELATHICVDCGYIYCDRTPFSELDPDWRCPQCRAPKKRFALYDKKTGRAKGGVAGDIATIATVVGGLIGIGILAYLGLQF